MNNKLRVKCLVSSILLTVTTPTLAGTIYTTYVDQDLVGGESVLATIDSSTGAVTEIGLTGAIRVGALTYDPIYDRLLGLGQNQSGYSSLFEIDTATGHATEIGALGSNIGSGGLAFHSGLNALFAIDSPGSGGGILVTVDLHTGAATPVGTQQQFGAWALGYYPPTNDLLFSIGFEEFGAPFGTFDPSTGVQTVINSNGSTIIGMDYDPDVDVLYGINGSFGPPGLGDKLFTIDPLTGQATLAVTLSRAEFYSSLAVIPIPAPSAAVALGLSGLVVGGRRRR